MKKKVIWDKKVICGLTRRACHDIEVNEGHSWSDLNMANEGGIGMKKKGSGHKGKPRRAGMTLLMQKIRSDCLDILGS